MKRTFKVTSAATLLIFIICIFAATNIYAAQKLKFTVDSLDMDKTDLGNSSAAVYLDESCDESIDNIEVSKEGIVYVSPEIEYIDDEERSYLDITAIGKGDVVITVTGDEGTVVKLPVHVGSKGLMNSLKQNTSIGELYYGDTELTVNTLAGANVTASIGSKELSPSSTKKFDVDKSIQYKLDKMYDAGTRLRVTVEKDNVVFIRTKPLRKYTYTDYIKASGKVLKVEVYNIHKGDVIKIKYSGKTYTNKVKKNHSYEPHYFRIIAKKKINKNAKIKVEIRNKYKTLLSKNNIRLKKGKWQAPPRY